MRYSTIGVFILIASCPAAFTLAQTAKIEFRPRSTQPRSTDRPAAQAQTPQNALRAQSSFSDDQIGGDGRSDVRTVAAQSPAVSRDLSQVYEQTKTAKTEQSITAIADACTKVVSDRRRSKLDREYAASLLAWALNRRGEMRSDQAAELVQQNQLSEADKLDRQASNDFENAIRYAPDNWRTHHNFAIALAMKSAYRRAIAEFSKAIDLKPDYSNSYFNRGELYFEVEDYASAISDYSEAIRIDPSDAQYHNSRAHSKFMLEVYDEAIIDYEKAVELAANDAVYQTDLADAYQFLGEWKSAAATYQAAVAADNKYPRAYQNAAWLMATCPEKQFRNPELALAAAKKAIELTGEKTSRGLDTLAAATAAAGKTEKAVELQREALAVVVDDFEREELEQRMQIYDRGSSDQQPQPVEAVASGRSEEVESLRIRTASGDNGRSR